LDGIFGDHCQHVGEPGLRIWAGAARMNSSRAPFGPRRRSSLRMRQDLSLPDCCCRLDIDDDRILDVDQVVRRVGEEGLAAVRAVRRAAGSEGDTNFEVTSVAAPKVASSRTARYSSMSRPVASDGSPLPPSIPFCRLASALIRLASTANPSPPTNPSLMQRRRTLEHAAEEIALSKSGHACS
jgi:hypothetical protein